MENRHLSFAPTNEWLEFLYGSTPERARTPQAIAWTLERDAVESGWPLDGFMGSELDLMRCFGVSRAIIRQAIRIVESHGSMRMGRGRSGGLRLTSASAERTAAALAIYLRASGSTAAELSALARVADPLFAERPDRDLVAAVYRHTLQLFATGAADNSSSSTQAAAIAFGLLTSGALGAEPLPKQGRPLGSEALLCERFNASRGTLRQALRIIDDLGMLEVKRGRGGGYLLKRSSVTGIMRYTFTLFASHHQVLADIVPVTWVLNLISLRLCAEALQRVDQRTRERHRAELCSMLASAPEPARWVVLQQAIERLAAAPLIGTLQRCIVAYQGRLGGHIDAFSSIAEPLGVLEDRIVAALCNGDQREAERHLRAAQHMLSRGYQLPPLPPERSLCEAER